MVHSSENIPEFSCRCLFLAFCVQQDTEMCVVHWFIKRIFLLQQARPPWAEQAFWRLTFSCHAAVVDSSASVLSLQLQWFRCLQQSSAWTLGCPTDWSRSPAHPVTVAWAEAPPGGCMASPWGGWGSMPLGHCCPLSTRRPVFLHFSFLPFFASHLIHCSLQTPVLK